MKPERPWLRALAALIVAAVVFAPAPRDGLGRPVNELARGESLAGQILSPTFEEGLAPTGIRAFEAPQRGDTHRPLIPAVVSILTLAVSLSLTAPAMPSRRSLRRSNVFASPGSRGPPLPALS
jgi:hypothetical protein